MLRLGDLHVCRESHPELQSRYLSAPKHWHSISRCGPREFGAAGSSLSAMRLGFSEGPHRLEGLGSQGLHRVLVMAELWRVDTGFSLDIFRGFCHASPKPRL